MQATLSARVQQVIVLKLYNEIALVITEMLIFKFTSCLRCWNALMVYNCFSALTLHCLMFIDQWDLLVL